MAKNCTFLGCNYTSYTHVYSSLMQMGSVPLWWALHCVWWEIPPTHHKITIYQSTWTNIPEDSNPMKCSYKFGSFTGSKLNGNIIMNCEKTRICKETVIVYLKIVTSHLSGQTEKERIF